MKVEEANKIIAKFMGWKFSQLVGFTNGYGYMRNKGEELLTEHFEDYYISLDKLVPVWEKLKPETDEWVITLGKTISSGFSGYYAQVIEVYNSIESEGNTIQEAAAIATAKAIKELE